MISIDSFIKKKLFVDPVRRPLVKIIFENTSISSTYGLKSFSLDITEYVTNFGRISRKLEIDKGLFIPGSHSFELQNTKSLGNYIFTAGRLLGITDWTGIIYHIYIGFLELPTSIGIVAAAGSPFLASLGFGNTPALLFDSPVSLGYLSTPTGIPSLDSVEHLRKIYTGIITNKEEDRIEETVSVNSNDFMQIIADYKFCTQIEASSIFTYTNYTDTRGFTYNLRYGILKLNRNSNKEITTRNNPFDAMVCFPNLAEATKDGTYQINCLWFGPCNNDLKPSSATYTEYTDGDLRVWYWDYIARQWRFIDDSYISPVGSIVKIEIGSINGLYVKIENTGSAFLGPNKTDTWNEYLNGNGTYFNIGTDTSKIDVDVCIDTESLNDSQNPIKIIYDILISRLALNSIYSDILDFSGSFTLLDTEYSFDDVYSYFNNLNGKINISYDTEISALTVIGDICKLCGISFICGPDKNQSQRRNIRLIFDKAYNPCLTTPPILLQYSTKDRLAKFKFICQNEDKIDKIICTNYDSSVSTKDSMDIVAFGTGNKILQLSPPKNPPVYFYDSYQLALALMQRLYKKLNAAIHTYFTEMDMCGFISEVGDYIKLHDQVTDEEIVSQIVDWNYDLQNKVNVESKRYRRLYGPDENNKYKKWAFCDCAYAGTDQIGGSGTDATIALGGTTVTLASGGTIDPLRAKIGMCVRIETEYFRLLSITDSTHFEVDAVAVAAHANKTWSIGNSYHVW